MNFLNELNFINEQNFLNELYTGGEKEWAEQRANDR